MSRKDNLLGSFGISKHEDAPVKDQSEAQILPATKKEQKKRESMVSSIMFYGDSGLYAKLRAKELKAEGFTKGKTSISEYVEWLIDNDKKANPKTAAKARQLYELENE